MIIICQIISWDKPLPISLVDEEKTNIINDLKLGDRVIIKTGQGIDLATVIELKGEELTKQSIAVASRESQKPETEEAAIILLRKATSLDLEKMIKKNEHREQAFQDCEQLIKKHNLPMKLIDVIFHFDGGRITFAFTAASKVDFRELVKDLAKKFHRSIRLYQVGARQEVELAGDIGPCGRPLCCLKFLQKLGNVTTDLIFDQQIAHRGVERLSGICGRLKCCLVFEEDNYKELAKNIPPQGALVKTIHGDGKIIARQILKQTVTVQFDSETTTEVPVKDIKEIKNI